MNFKNAAIIISATTILQQLVNMSAADTIYLTLSSFIIGIYTD